MLKRVVNILSRMPLSVHYAIADYVLYPLLYHIVRYRRKMVMMNLQKSFPDLNEKQRTDICRRFYHHFADTIVRIIYGYTATEKEMAEHIQFQHVELLDEMTEKYGGVIATMGHLGTWEWLLEVAKHVKTPNAKVVGVYRQLKNKSMDELMLDIRRQRSEEVVEKNKLLRYMVANRVQKIPQMIGMLADQKPNPKYTHYWTEFLHQDTGFVDGSEQLGRKFNYPIVFFYVTSPKRGYYNVDIRLLSEHPGEEAPYSITEKYARMLEQNIIEQPELWLWTHNRWKYNRNSYIVRKHEM